MSAAPAAQVTRRGFLDMQVCVPEAWTDQQARAFAENQYPCGTTNGWQIRREGDAALQGAAERVCCSERAGFVHLMLDA